MPEGSLLIPDEYPANDIFHEFIPNSDIAHRVHQVDGMVNTNKIEGVWALLKWAWHGS